MLIFDCITCIGLEVEEDQDWLSQWRNIYNTVKTGKMGFILKNLLGSLILAGVISGLGRQ